jgi:hypothetical protein
MTEIFERVESPAYSWQVNVHAGHQGAQHAITGSWEFNVLCALPREVLVARIRTLLPLPDKRYANPQDHAIAAYLMALREGGSDDVIDLAWEVYHTPGLFWARRVAGDIWNAGQTQEEEEA